MSMHALYKPASFDLLGVSEQELKTIRLGLSKILDDSLSQVSSASAAYEVLRTHHITARNILASTNEVIEDRNTHESEESDPL